MKQKILVVCYSFSNGNTRKIAKQLSKALKADYAEIETTVPYPIYGGFESEVVSQGKREVETGFQPEIKPLPFNLDDYSIVAIGTPTWWFTMAPAMKTFLNNHNWKGKSIIPFMTHGGWPGHVIKDLESSCPGAKFLPSMNVQFDSEGGDKIVTSPSEIDAWIKKVKRALSNNFN